MILQVEGLTKKFGQFTAVETVSLSINGGEIYGLLGPNGAGKTTLLQMIVGLLEPTSGKVLIDGRDLTASPAYAKQRIGYVPDNPYLYNRLTGHEFLHFVADLWNVDRQQKPRRIAELLAFFDLTRAAHNYTETYSHGMKKKLALAAAMVYRPKLLVLDEPFAGLDAKSVSETMEFFKRQVATGHAVLLSSHHMAEVVEKICTRVGIVNHGTLILDRQLSELLAETESKYGRRQTMEEVFIRLVSGAMKD
jgi:ABC-2 type transport system ATP-binding protein